MVEEEAMATMRRIGMGLIEEKKREVLGERGPTTTRRKDELDERTKGRDLLSVLSPFFSLQHGSISC